MKNKHDITTYVLGLVTIVALMFIYYIVASEVIFSRADKARMIVNFNVDKKRVFLGNTIENMTILEALFASTKDSDLKLSYYVDDHNDIMLNVIGDQINNVGNKKWNFFLNQREIDPKDINKIFLREGDLIEARYN